MNCPECGTRLGILGKCSSCRSARTSKSPFDLLPGGPCQKLLQLILAVLFSFSVAAAVPPETPNTTQSEVSQSGPTPPKLILNPPGESLPLLAQHRSHSSHSSHRSHSSHSSHVSGGGGQHSSHSSHSSHYSGYVPPAPYPYPVNPPPVPYTPPASVPPPPQPPKPVEKHVGTYRVVAANDNDRFVTLNEKGVEVIFYVEYSLDVVYLDGSYGSFNDIQEGQKVAVTYTMKSGKRIAKKVKILSQGTR